MNFIVSCADGEPINYVYNGDMLIREERGDNNTLYFGDNLVAGDNANEGDGVRLDSLNTTILEYFYGQDGVAGIVYEGQKYYFRRNIQGDVTHIYTIDGILKVCYTYDAWGNHKVLDADGKVNTAPSFIGNVNPFRYRGYYYDRETGLYFCESRYYDPEVGRWINADSIEYLDPETINGLNLYAYCLNNPIMMVDPSGCAPKWWQWLLGGLIIVAGIALSVVTGGLAAPIAAGLGGGLFGAMVGGAVAGAIGGAITGFAFSVASQGIVNGFTNINWGQVGVSTLIGVASGALVGGIGSGIKYGRAASYLKSNGVTDVKGTLKNFKGIPSVKTSKGINALRYYDNVGAFQKGRWLTNALSNNPIDDLVLYNNQATYVSQLFINNGAKYLVGKVAGSPIKALQYFVANLNWLSLLG